MTWLLRPGRAGGAPRRRPPAGRPRPASGRWSCPTARAVRCLLVELRPRRPALHARRRHRARAGPPGPRRGWSCPPTTRRPERRRRPRWPGARRRAPTASCRRRVRLVGEAGAAAPPGTASCAPPWRWSWSRRRAGPRPARRLGPRRDHRTWWSRRRRPGRGWDRSWCREPPPACAASTPTPARPTRAVPLVVEQLAATEPLRPPATRPGAAGASRWPGRSATSSPLAEGGAPATWSATVDLERAAAGVTTCRRHPHCGCAWADASPAPRGRVAG